MKVDSMKTQMRRRQPPKESAEPEVESGAFKATSLIAAAQIAVALVIAITVGAIVEGDYGTMAAHDFPDRAPASTAATTTAQTANSGTVGR